MRELVVIQASHYRQACLVAEQLDLPIPNKPAPVGWNNVADVRYVHERSQAIGLLPDRVIFAYPRIELTIVDHVQHDGVREALLVIAAAARVGVERVTT